PARADWFWRTRGRQAASARGGAGRHERLQACPARAPRQGPDRGRGSRKHCCRARGGAQNSGTGQMSVTTATSNPVERVGTTVTEHASRYLQQLCKHFGHKMQVSFDERAGEITFPFGHCAMAATDGQLHITLTARDHDTMERLTQVVVSHLVRFAFREELAFAWTPAPVI